MKQILLLLTLVTSTGLPAQIADLETVKVDTDFAWRNSTLAERDSFYFNLPVLRNSHFKTHFRVSIPSQTIDFFSNDNDRFQGLLVNKTTEYKSTKTEWGKRTKAYRYVFQKVAIDTALSTTIAKQILKSCQDAIPTDTLIPSWSKWYLHCGSMEFQFMINRKYHAESFHCPWSQPDTTEFAEVIVSNYELIKCELDLDRRFDEFEAQLTRGKTYSRDGHIMTYLMTQRESKAWSKGELRRGYLQSIKDTIDSYLNFKLDSLEAAWDTTNFSFYGEYNLTFGKNGNCVSG